MLPNALVRVAAVIAAAWDHCPFVAALQEFLERVVLQRCVWGEREACEMNFVEAGEEASADKNQELEAACGGALAL